MKLPAKSRRSPGEARRQIIEAARRLFAQRGFEGVSFREVATEAGVNEALIFRSVGSKERLFHEAVIEPYHEFVSGWVDRWKRRKKPLSNEEMMTLFTKDLYSMLKENRELILALVAAHAFGSADVHREQGSLLSVELDRLAAQTALESAWRGFNEEQLGMNVRCVVGILMAFVLLDEWLLPPRGQRPSEKVLLKQISSFALAGLNGLPASGKKPSGR